MKTRIFIDGQEGTTGLKINEYLRAIPDIEILEIEEVYRKDKQHRQRMIEAADLIFLCLPDQAAIEAVALAAGKGVKVIDASTAHRTHADWVYGLPEWRPEQRALIRASQQVAVPGCHATGFILSLYPLVATGIVGSDYPAVCTALTGYSGGGKKMIAEYEQGNIDKDELSVPRHYALSLTHKHLPEMKHYAGLTHPPVFSPIVGPYFQGDAIGVPLHPRLFKRSVTPADIRELLAEYYQDEPCINVMMDEETRDATSFDLTACNATNRLDLFVTGHADQIMLLARFDNLGKGAAGAAIQNMNLMLGREELTGLTI